MVLGIFSLMKSTLAILLDNPCLPQNPLWPGFGICQKYKAASPMFKHQMLKHARVGATKEQEHQRLLFIVLHSRHIGIL